MIEFPSQTLPYEIGDGVVTHDNLEVLTPPAHGTVVGYTVLSSRLGALPQDRSTRVMELLVLVEFDDPPALGNGMTFSVVPVHPDSLRAAKP